MNIALNLNNNEYRIKSYMYLKKLCVGNFKHSHQSPPNKGEPIFQVPKANTLIGS